MMELEGRLMPPRAFQEFLETQELQAALTGARFLEEAQVTLTLTLTLTLALTLTLTTPCHSRREPATCSHER